MLAANRQKFSSTARWAVLPALVAVGVALLPTGLSAQSQAYNWRNVVTGGGGGFIDGIVFNPTQQNLLYARTDIGGAYRWNPATSTWIPLMDFTSAANWNLLGVDSIASDPVDPTRFYVAAGLYTNNFTTSNGAILRSTDQGNTFQTVMLPFKNGGNMPGRGMGERLAIDPNLNSTIYFGARSGNGLWKSTDFGVTWSKVTSFTAMATYVQVAGDNYLGDTDGPVWVVFDPASGTPGKGSKSIYVGIADLGNSVFHSADGGATWAPLAGQPTGFIPHHAVLASNGMLHISYGNGAGPFDGTKGDVWKYATATGTWTLISPLPSTNTGDYFGYGGLAVDALHPNTIMVAALNSWWPDTIFFRSTDGGATWTQIWNWTSYPSRSLRYALDITGAPWLNFGVTNPIPPVPAPKLGWMVEALAIDPFNSNHMLYGTGATMYGTTNLTNWDAGITFNLSVAASGIEETSVLGLVSPPSGAPLFSVMGDVTGFRHDDITKPPATMFTAPTSGTCTGIDYAELNPKFLVRVGSPNTAAVPPAFSTGFTFDGGTTWFQGNADPAGVAQGGTIAAAADASRVLWSDPGAGVHYSTDNGNSWPASTGIPTGAAIASDRVNPTMFYGFANGTFYVSTNAAVSFTASVTAGLPTSGKIKAVAGHQGDIWLAGGTSGLFHSTNSGASFSALAGVAQADNVGFGMPAPGATYPAVFVTGAINGVPGIFRSDNMGVSWVQINDAQHQYAATGQCITGDPRVYGRVYFCTNGRGIIVGDISGAQTPSFSLSATPATVTLNPGKSGTSTISVAPAGGFTGGVTFSASGLPAGVTASFAPASSTTSTVLTLTASATATAGAATVTVTGTSGTLTASTPITLTVVVPPPPSFTLSAAPATLTVNRGASATSTVSVVPVNGFAGSVTFSATGLPTGVTASFAPASSTTSSVLTLAASATAAAGAATITVSGTSGTLTASTPITLTVVVPPPPSFTLSAAPPALTLSLGASATSTISVVPVNGFAASVTFSATGLPAGVTATFAPASSTTGAVLTLAASATATTGAATVTVTGTSGTLTATTPISLTVTGVPGFSISAAPATVTLNRGASVTSTITVAPVNGFAGSVAFTATGLPAGVTATFTPASSTTSSVLTLAASATATAGLASVTVTGTSGALTATAAISLTVVAPAPDFSLSAAPATLTVNRGASGTSTISVTPINGFAGSVAFSASGLPTGVTASFAPASSTTSSVLTLAASATATLGAATVTITGTNGALTHTATVALTVGAGGGGVTVTPVINSNSPYFDDEGIKIANTTSITALSITITVQNTGGITFSGQYNTVGGTVAQSHTSTATTVTYQFTLAAGQTITPGTSYLFDAQMGGTGTAHPTTGDTYTVTYTTGGNTVTQTGHF